MAFGTGCSHAIRPKYHQTETPQGMDDGEFAVVGIEGLVAQSVLIDDAGTTPGRRAGGGVDGDHGRPASGAATDLGVENRARHFRRIRRPDAARRGATVPGARADETRRARVGGRSSHRPGEYLGRPVRHRPGPHRGLFAQVDGRTEGYNSIVKHVGRSPSESGPLRTRNAGSAARTHASPPGAHQKPDTLPTLKSPHINRAGSMQPGQSQYR